VTVKTLTLLQSNNKKVYLNFFACKVGTVKFI